MYYGSDIVQDLPSITTLTVNCGSGGVLYGPWNIDLGIDYEAAFKIMLDTDYYGNSCEYETNRL